jgi:hypothetical protein
MREAKPALFVLNTIGKVSQGGQGVEIQGECSPHCSTLECPNCGATIWVNWLFDRCVRNVDGGLLFNCKESSKISIVTLDDEQVSLSSLHGKQKRACRQSGLKLELDEGVLKITLGKLKWQM